MWKEKFWREAGKKIIVGVWCVLCAAVYYNFRLKEEEKRSILQFFNFDSFIKIKRK